MSSAASAFCSTISTVGAFTADILDDLEYDFGDAWAQGPAMAHRTGIMCGRDISDRAIASICCSPPDSVPAT